LLADKISILGFLKKSKKLRKKYLLWGAVWHLKLSLLSPMQRNTEVVNFEVVMVLVGCLTGELGGGFNNG
jgi:hypothetical protein